MQTPPRTTISQGETVTRRRVELDEFDLARDPEAAAVLTRLRQDRLLTLWAGLIALAVSGVALLLAVATD
jgi:hypothetical protein